MERSVPTAIVITAPMDLNWSADFHPFYGHPRAMQERTILDFNQDAAIGGGATIKFSVGSATYTMTINGTSDPDAGTILSTGTLDTGMAMLAFTLRTTLSCFSFTCL